MPDGNYSVAGIVTATGGGTYILCTDVSAAYLTTDVRLQVTTHLDVNVDRTSINVTIHR
jgi:hypothetical protein